MKRILITGAEGFVAHYLIEELKNDYNIYGTYFLEKELDIENEFLDITNRESVDNLIKKINPDIICHLAAQSSGGVSLKNPYLTYSVNVLGTLNIFESVKNFNKKIKIFIPSSADVYGKPKYLPVDEKHPLYANNPYSSSKIIIENIAKQYIDHFNLNIILTRSFNHTGVYQDSRFFIPSVIEQIKKAKNDDTIYVGNINIKRDFLDVRDVVKAYKQLFEIERGTFNVASGKSIELKKIIEHIIKISNKNIKIQISQDKIRKNEVQEIYGSYELINKTIAWKPKINILHTLEWMFEYNE